MYQVKFKYSLIKDIKTYFEVSNQKKFLEEENIIIFKPSFIRFLKIIFNKPKIVFKTDSQIICYWVTNGTWGAYKYPDKIIIMPFDLPEDMSLYELIEHEIDHLKHPEAEKLDHKDKENYIESLKKSGLKKK